MDVLHIHKCINNHLELLQDYNCLLTDPLDYMLQFMFPKIIKPIKNLATKRTVQDSALFTLPLVSGKALTVKK